MATHLLPPPRDHDDDGLDEMLQRSAPPVARGPKVDAHLEAMLRAARDQYVTSLQSRRRPKLRRRLALGAGAVVLAVSGASMAAANDDTPDEFLRDNAGATLLSMTDQAAPGRCAGVFFDLDADRDSVDSPAYRAAVAYLSTLTVGDIDPTQDYLKNRESLTELGEGYSNAGATVPLKDVVAADVLLSQSYSDTVYRMLEADLARQGLKIGKWSSSGGGYSCHAPARDQGLVG